MYESRPHAVIVTLGNKLYRIPEVAPPTTISLVTAKQCSKLISKTRKFVFLMIRPQGKKKTVAAASRRGPSPRQLQMEKVVEEYEDISTSPTGEVKMSSYSSTTLSICSFHVEGPCLEVVATVFFFP